MHRFEIYKDKKGETRFRFRAGNGEPMFSSESYRSKASAVKAIESIKKNAPGATVEDMSAAAAAPKAKAANGKAPAAAKAKAAEKPAAAARPKAAAKAKPNVAAKAKPAAKPKAAKAKAPA